MADSVGQREEAVSQMRPSINQSILHGVSELGTEGRRRETGVSAASVVSATCRAMDDLPEEVWGRVLSQLDARSVCMCTAVCRKWKRAAEQEHVWRALVVRIWPSFAFLPSTLLCFSGASTAGERAQDVGAVVAATEDAGDLSEYLHRDMDLLKWFLCREYPIGNWKQVFAAMYYRDIAMPYKVHLRSEILLLSPTEENFAHVKEVVDQIQEQARVYPLNAVHIGTQKPPLSPLRHILANGRGSKGGAAMVEGSDMQVGQLFLKETMSIEETNFVEKELMGRTECQHLVLTQLFALTTGELVPFRYRHRWSEDAEGCLVTLAPLMELQGSPYQLSISSFSSSGKGLGHSVAALRDWRRLLGLSPATISLLGLFLVLKKHCTTLHKEECVAPTIRREIGALQRSLAKQTEEDPKKLPVPTLSFSTATCAVLFHNNEVEQQQVGHMWDDDFGVDSDDEGAKRLEEMLQSGRYEVVESGESGSDIDEEDYSELRAERKRRREKEENGWKEEGQDGEMEDVDVVGIAGVDIEAEDVSSCLVDGFDIIAMEDDDSLSADAHYSSLASWAHDRNGTSDGMKKRKAQWPSGGLAPLDSSLPPAKKAKR